MVTRRQKWWLVVNGDFVVAFFLRVVLWRQQAVWNKKQPVKEGTGKPEASYDKFHFNGHFHNLHRSIQFRKPFSIVQTLTVIKRPPLSNTCRVLNLFKIYPLVFARSVTDWWEWLRGVGQACRPCRWEEKQSSQLLQPLLLLQRLSKSCRTTSWPRHLCWRKVSLLVYQYLCRKLSFPARQMSLSIKSIVGGNLQQGRSPFTLAGFCKECKSDGVVHSTWCVPGFTQLASQCAATVVGLILWVWKESIYYIWFNIMIPLQIKLCGWY